MAVRTAPNIQEVFILFLLNEWLESRRWLTSGPLIQRLHFSVTCSWGGIEEILSSFLTDYYYTDHYTGELCRAMEGRGAGLGCWYIACVLGGMHGGHRAWLPKSLYGRFIIFSIYMIG
jgi:hypothetical protein